MDDLLSDLLDELDGIHRRLIAASLRDPGVAASLKVMIAEFERLMGMGGDVEYKESARVRILSGARAAFYKLPDKLQEVLLNGWTPAGPRPPRGDLLAAAELASVRRVLSLSVGTKTLIPSHHWALCDGSAAVRMEIQEGATHDQVMTALGWIACSLATPKMWAAMINASLAAELAKSFEQIDLGAATAKAGQQNKGAPAAGQVAAGQKT